MSWMKFRKYRAMFRTFRVRRRCRLVGSRLRVGLYDKRIYRG